MKLRLAVLTTAVLLAGCRHSGDITSENGGGIYSVRSAGPLIGVPAGTGDITTFNPPTSTDARAIDVSATITYVRATCVDSGNDVVSTDDLESALTVDAGTGERCWSLARKPTKPFLEYPHTERIRAVMALKEPWARPWGTEHRAYYVARRLGWRMHKLAAVLYAVVDGDRYSTSAGLYCYGPLADVLVTLEQRYTAHRTKPRARAPRTRT